MTKQGHAQMLLQKEEKKIRSLERQTIKKKKRHYTNGHLVAMHI
jgi:hypothetical protein